MSERRQGAGHRQKPEATAKRVGKRIRALRLAADFSFDAWVEELGMGRGYVSELERGLVAPRLDTLGRIARALEMTIADLVVGDTPRERLFAAMRGLPDEITMELLWQFKEPE